MQSPANKIVYPRISLIQQGCNPCDTSSAESCVVFAWKSHLWTMQFVTLLSCESSSSSSHLHRIIIQSSIFHVLTEWLYCASYGGIERPDNLHIVIGICFISMNWGWRIKFKIIMWRAWVGVITSHRLHHVRRSTHKLDHLTLSVTTCQLLCQRNLNIPCNHMRFKIGHSHLIQSLLKTGPKKIGRLQRLDDTSTSWCYAVQEYVQMLMPYFLYSVRKSTDETPLLQRTNVGDEENLYTNSRCNLWLSILVSLHASHLERQLFHGSISGQKIRGTS